MEQQQLSEQAKQAFYYNLQHSEHKEKHSFILKMAAVAVCILLLIPITVYAVEHIFGVSVDMVDSNMRRQAKAVNFGILYGISSYGLSEDLGISVKDAKDFINKKVTLLT